MRILACITEITVLSDQPNFLSTLGEYTKSVTFPDEYDELPVIPMYNGFDIDSYAYRFSSRSMEKDLVWPHMRDCNYIENTVDNDREDPIIRVPEMKLPDNFSITDVEIVCSDMFNIYYTDPRDNSECMVRGVDYYRQSRPLLTSAEGRRVAVLNNNGKVDRLFIRDGSWYTSFDKEEMVDLPGNMEDVRGMGVTRGYLFVLMGSRLMYYRPETGWKVYADGVVSFVGMKSLPM